MKHDKQTTTLLIIDVQKGAFSGNKMPPLLNGEKVLENIKKLIIQHRKRSLPIIYIQDCGKIGGAFEKGTNDWKIHPRITPQLNELVILKEGPCAFIDTTLKYYLEKNSIKNLLIVGLHSEHCYKNSVLSALELGHHVTVVCDGHSTIDNQTKKASNIVREQNNFLASKGAQLNNTSELLSYT